MLITLSDLSAPIANIGGFLGSFYVLHPASVCTSRYPPKKREVLLVTRAFPLIASLPLPFYRAFTRTRVYFGRFPLVVTGCISERSRDSSRTARRGADGSDGL